MIEHANNFQLLPPDIANLVVDIEKDENVQYIKEWSDEWFVVHKKARVMGSTLNAAIGLDTLMKQKNHHYVHIRGCQPPSIPLDLQKKFDYGTKNEVNGISLLISTIVPAYLPACYTFYEVGASFISSGRREKLVEVGMDGILQCTFSENCPNYAMHGERKIVVEIKSPVPQENIAKTIFYEVPAQYMPQLQVELTAYLACELWLVCSMAISTTVIVVNYDEALWMKTSNSLPGSRST